MKGRRETEKNIIEKWFLNAYCQADTDEQSPLWNQLVNNKNTVKSFKKPIVKYVQNKADLKIKKLQGTLDQQMGANAANFDRIDDYVSKLEK